MIWWSGTSLGAAQTTTFPQAFMGFYRISSSWIVRSVEFDTCNLVLYTVIVFIVFVNFGIIWFKFYITLRSDPRSFFSIMGADPDLLTNNTDRKPWINAQCTSSTAV